MSLMCMRQNCLASALLIIHTLRFSIAQPLAPAPGPSSLSNQRCQQCPAPAPSAPRSLNLSIVVETDVAQFYSYTTEGAILVYFVARAVFSNAPAQLSLTDFDVADGNLLEIVAENSCTSFLLKGAVQQQSAWFQTNTSVTVSTNQSSTSDCQGVGFPAASATSTATNGPVGSMYVPNLAYTQAGPITTTAINLVQLYFSEPIVGLDITQLNVTLITAVDAQAAGVTCVPSYHSQALPVVQNSTQFYDIYISVPDCFLGQVSVGFHGQVQNMQGQNSLPIKPVGFNKVATTIPVMTSQPTDPAPSLGAMLKCSS